MNDIRGIKQRLKALRYNLKDLNERYESSLTDTHTAVGIEYYKKYSIDEMNKLNEAQKELKRDLIDRLFTSIFNFTQTYYSIKEYLNNQFPDRKNIIENFFSNAQNRTTSRKAISNDLKHNPDNDLMFENREMPKESYIKGKTHFINIKFKETWFYDNEDSVELCNHLYDDLIEFLYKNFNSR